MEHVEHFNNTGELLKGTYYFDPPLNESEIEILYNILRNVKNSETILNPLSLPVTTLADRTLLWLDVYDNGIHGWQNVDTSEDEDGETYTLKDLDSIKKWCAMLGDCQMPFRDGRLFLKVSEIDVDDIFNQINESNLLIQKILKRYFKK